MKYMTDANLAHIAAKLKEKGIDCETLHKRMRDNERSEEKIVDGEIITSDIDLSDHCRYSEVPFITIWDTVSEHIAKTKN